MLDGSSVDCPYCGESLWIPVDPSGGSRQQFISDCEVCCRPIEITVRIDADGELWLEVRTDS